MRRPNMGWKKVVGVVNLAVQYIPEMEAMRKDDDEETFIVHPEAIPAEQPVEQPAQQPVEVPEKEPQKVGRAVVAEEDESVKKQRHITGELVGYRHAQAAKRDGQWMFHSPRGNFPWERGVATARCDLRQHEPPDAVPGDDCTCGLYATWNEDTLPREHRGTNSDWTTQVKAWGKVRTSPSSPRVMRIEHMSVSGIRLPKCESCPDKPASHLISSGEQAFSGRPVCEDHAPETIDNGRTKVLSTPVDHVAKELSEFYGGVPIIGQGEAWGHDEMSDFERDVKSAGKWARVGWTNSRPKV